MHSGLNKTVYKLEGYGGRREHRNRHNRTENVILKWESKLQSLLIFSVRPIPSEMMKTMCYY